MEMDNIPMDNNMKGNEDESADQLPSSCSSDTSDIFGAPKVLPRVGDQYQAEIPPLIAKCDLLQLINKPTNSEIMVTLPTSFSLGLPIPLMWAKSEVKGINRAVEFENNEEIQITSTNGCADPKVEPLDFVSGNEKDVQGYSNLQPTAESDKMDVDLVLPQESETKLNQVGRAFCPLPGSLGESWTDIEHDSFLLGLYIFGKNLILVKRFVERKKMADILSFYYGKFYRSAKYHRWSECWKLKSRRSIHGQKIFTGWRQNELLSRLKSHSSEESQNMLLEASKTFNEGKFSFEEYVFTLKNTVGIDVLVEAVGIGKGKQDLTGTAMEPSKANHVLSVRPEIPTGKACASLTSADIIKFLKGDFRLSKARSSDLFWEAVWPRLLARGWHSEQPKDHGISGSKLSLVFLIPGVKKFSSRLVKGKHYFDSISDVLNKVVSKPGLLELEIEAAKGSEHEEEYKCNPPMKRDSDGVSNKQRHCFLQPRNSSCNRDLIKFIIIDTSLIQGAKRPKLRGLRSLPVETTCLFIPSILSSETEQDTSEDSKDEVQETNTSSPVVDMKDVGACADCVDTILKTDALDPTIVAVENHKSHSTTSDYEKQQRKTMQHQSRRKVKHGHLKYLAPVTKQQSMTGGSNCHVENIAADSKPNEDEPYCRSNSPDACDAMAFTTHNLSPANYLAEGSPGRSNEGNVKQNCLIRETSPEKPQVRTLIDLNVPQVSLGFGTDEPFITDMVQNNVNACANKPSFLSETSQQLEPFRLSDNGASKDQQPVMNNQRQSRRNRALTPKAIEAYAFGYYSPKKRKCADAPQNKLKSRSSQRVCGRIGVSATSNNGDGMDIANSRIEESLDGLHSDINLVGEFQV